MKNLLRQSRIHYLVNNRNGYLTLAALSIVANILMVGFLFYSKGYERTVIVPSIVTRSFWVSSNQVSREYLADMALFFVNLRFSVTPANAAMQRDIILRYVEPKHYQAIKSALMLEAEHMTKEHVISSFYPIDYPKVDEKKLIVSVPGDLNVYVGETRLPAQRLIYQIHFSYTGRQLLVKTFEEVKDNA